MKTHKMPNKPSSKPRILPMRVIPVTFLLPEPLDLKRIDTWLNDHLAIRSRPTPEPTEVGNFVSRVLQLSVHLLQISTVPVFHPGSIVSIVQDHQTPAKHTVQLALAHVDYFPEQYYHFHVNTAFNVVGWMIQHSLTPQNVATLYSTVMKSFLETSRNMRHGGRSTVPILRAADSLEIPFIHLGKGIYQLGWGSKARKMDRSATDNDAAIGLKLSQNKVSAANLVRMAGLPAPTHFSIPQRDKAAHYARKLGYPVVVKPTDRERGEGVTVDIENDTQLLSAFDEAYKLSQSKQVIVEKQVPGVCHRLFVTHGGILYGVKRNPKSVLGDAKHSVRQLIELANHKESVKPPWDQETVYPADALAQRSIQQVGHTFHSVPKRGERVPLRPIESTEWGAYTEDVSNRIHPANAELALRAAALFGLYTAGIDIITPDISVPWYENGAIINEINFAPFFGVSKVSENHIPPFLERFIEQKGRIPIEVFVCDETSYEHAAARQNTLQSEGKRCYLTTERSTFSSHENELHMPATSLSQRCTALLLNSDVDAIIVALHSDEALHTGLPFDRIDALHILTENVTSSDLQTTAVKEHLMALTGLLKSLLKEG